MLKSQLEYVDSESSNLGLLVEYGESAWVADNANTSALLAHARSKLDACVRERDQLLLQQEAKRNLFDKELKLVETDLQNYVRNNEKTLVGLKQAERRAKKIYRKGENPKLDKIAESLLT